MADSIRDPTWWQPYLPQLRREFSELTMDILLAGGDAGAGSIRAGSIMMDWDVFNEDALTWLDMYLGGRPIPGLTQEGAYAWAWALNETTRRNVVREIDRWIRNGAPLPELELRLRNFFDDKRARRIAATEVTRIYASGNVMAWKASGVIDGKRWQTARDERVCSVCGRLHNTFVELSGGWEFSAEALATNPGLKRALGAPLTVIVPPAHVACRCWLQPVVFAAMSDEEVTAARFRPDAPIVTAPTKPVIRPVSQAIDIPRTSNHRRIYERAMELIDRVHNDGNLPPLRIWTKHMKLGHIGAYYADNIRGTGRSRIEITRTPFGHGRLTLTTLHEIGHFLDHHGIPSVGMWASRNRNVTEVWYQSVTGSRAVRKLFTQLRDSAIPGMVSDGIISVEDYQKHLRYLLSVEEVWARSYAQYIAVRSGDAAVLAAVDIERQDPFFKSTQWDDDDFVPIARAFDTLFEVLGWLKR